ncbi:MAG: hypothetical protein JNM76_12625 [Betaproteobacteria bacterium]|nr:hypothetical protein [Betaproteobacteria bacterium]
MDRWTVDLRAAPGEALYTQLFVVEPVDVAKRGIAGNFHPISRLAVAHQHGLGQRGG